MTLSRPEIVDGLVAELEAFGQLIGPLDAGSWSAPTRCDSWTAADVAAHVVGSMADVVNGRLEGLGSPEVTARQVAERQGREPAELASELAQVTELAALLAAGFDDAAWASPAPGGYDGPLGDAVEALWYDTFLHADDIRAALGRRPERGPGMRPTVHHLAILLEKRGWGPASLSFDGVETLTIGADDRSGVSLTGDPLPFVLAATGRGDPLALGLDQSVNIYA